MSRATIRRLMREHRGATIIFVALSMVMILGFAALAVDVGYLYVVRNQLQNAADSGALAGAQVLYNDAGTSVNDLADDVGDDYARRHLAEQEEVVVLSSERGHWSFATRTFTPNDSLAPVDLWDATTEELDANTDFINAVRVITRRKRDAGGSLPAHFFGQIFGGPRAEVMATAVGYIGFAGTVEPDVFDQPIAICQEAIRYDGVYSCGVGRMINSGEASGTSQTGGWTNFTQPCETTSVPTVRPLVCSGNPVTVTFGDDMGTVGGMQDNVFADLVDCWAGRDNYNRRVDPPPDQPVRWKLPVIECPANNTLNCSRVVGTVEVDVVWINHQQDPSFEEVPRRMRDPRRTDNFYWECPSAVSGQTCWNNFATYFNLRWDVGSTGLATYEHKTIYFLPNCEPHEPEGLTGGENFGVLAKIPVLVK